MDDRHFYVLVDVIQELLTKMEELEIKQSNDDDKRMIKLQYECLWRKLLSIP